MTKKWMEITCIKLKNDYNFTSIHFHVKNNKEILYFIYISTNKCFVYDDRPWLSKSLNCIVGVRFVVWISICKFLFVQFWFSCIQTFLQFFFITLCLSVLCRPVWNICLKNIFDTSSYCTWITLVKINEASQWDYLIYFRLSWGLLLTL